MAVVTLLLGGRSSKTRYVITSRLSDQVKKTKKIVYFANLTLM